MKKITLPLLLLLLMTGLNSKAQSWEKLFSGISTDVFRCVREVPAGGYIVAGYTADSTSHDTDAFVVRMTTSGDTSWTFRYNGPMSKKDLFYKVIPTLDGGFALCGYTTSVTGTSDDLLYLKLSSTGQQQWVKFWGGSGKDRGQDIIQLADGSYTIVGYTTSAPAQYYDAFMLRASAIGDTLWTRRFGAANYDDANSVQVLSDGGFILGGQSTNGANGLDQYLVRVNSAGSVIWTQRFGGLYTDNIDAVLVVSGGFILGGSKNSGVSDDGYIVKTDTGGVFVWGKTYGGSLPDDFHRIDVAGSGFIASGTTTSTGPGLPNMWLMRVNATGDSLWSKTYGGDNHDHGYSGQATSDGGYIIAGHTGSFGYLNEEAYIVKTDASGNIANPLTYTTVLALINPTTSTCGASNTQVKLVIKNFGRRTVTSVPIAVQVTGTLTTTLNQTYSSTFAPLESDTITFTSTLNTSSGGTYTLKCSTDNDNDVYPLRNSLTRTFTIAATGAMPVVTGGSNCGSASIPLSATAASGTIYWFTGPSGGASVATGTSYNTPVINSTTTYYVQTNLTCPSARIPVTAVINPLSQTPVTTGASNCGSAALTLTAVSADTINWYSTASGGSPVGTGASFTTPTLVATTTYYAEAHNGVCPSTRVPAVATISSAAADPVVSPVQHCGSDFVTITATSPDPVFWFDSISGGTQLDTGITFTTPFLTTTTTFYAQADNGCMSNRVPVTVTINPLAPDPVITAGQNCGPGTVILSATASNPLMWFDSISGGTQLATGSTFNTPIISTSTIYYVVAYDSLCPSNRIAVTASILPLPIINLGADTSVSGTTYLIDAGPGFNSYLWNTGASTQTITVNTTDTFCVTVGNVFGCESTDCIFVDVSVGVSEIQNKLFGVYPNPTSEEIKIDFASMNSNATVELMNITGETVKQFDSINSAFVNVDLSDLPKGIYLVRVSNGKQTSVERIVLQ